MPIAPEPNFASSQRILILGTALGQSPLVELGPEGFTRLCYTPYGLQSSPRPPFGFSGFNGQFKEAETGWYHLGNGHRLYNPTLMRFHSPDRLSPFGKGGLNPYAYCEGDPINFEDPTGQFVAALANFLNELGTAARHSENIVEILFRARPAGLLGYATLFNRAGYVTTTAGAAMNAAGYTVGTQVTRVGYAFVSVGTTLRATNSAIEGVKASRFLRTFRRNIARQPKKIRPFKSSLKQVPGGSDHHTKFRIKVPSPTRSPPSTLYSSLVTETTNVRNPNSK